MNVNLSSTSKVSGPIQSKTTIARTPTFDGMKSNPLLWDDLHLHTSNIIYLIVPPYTCTLDW